MLIIGFHLLVLYLFHWAKKAYERYFPRQVLPYEEMEREIGNG